MHSPPPSSTKPRKVLFLIPPTRHDLDRSISKGEKPESPAFRKSGTQIGETQTQIGDGKSGTFFNSGSYASATAAIEERPQPPSFDLFLIPPSRHDLARSISNGEKPESPAGMVKPRSGDVWWFVEER